MYTNSAYEPLTCFDRPPRRPKNTVKSSVAATGWMIAQSPPSTVCL